MLNENIMNFINIAISFIGIITIIINLVLSGVITRVLKLSENKDSARLDYVSKKHKALSELNDLLCFKSNKIQIIKHPRDACPVSMINNNDKYIMRTTPVLERLDFAHKITLKLNKFMIKNQVYLSSEIIDAIGILVAYLNNYIFQCSIDKLTPNKLTALLLRSDWIKISEQLFDEIKKEYGRNSHYKFSKTKSLLNKKDRNKFLNKTNNFYILNLIAFNDIDDYCREHNCYDKRLDFAKIERNSFIYEHAVTCLNCNLQCELSGLYFNSNKT